jgi:FkbM family methyltransferase
MMATSKEAIEMVQVGGRDIPFAYPDSGNAKMHFQNILAGKDYAPLQSFWNFNPTTIIDIGANVGATAICFRNRYPNVPIYCFEPAAANLTYLHRNARLLDQVTVVPYGLYGEDKVASLYHGNVQCLQHSIFQSPEVNEKDSEPVKLRDAYELLRDRLVGRCILKIDTEGCELSILRRIKPLLHHVDIIYLEYHHEQQRRLLDKELDSYSIISSGAKFLHRGNVTYGSARLVKEHPGLDQWGIQPGDS